MSSANVLYFGLSSQLCTWSKYYIHTVRYGTVRYGTYFTVLRLQYPCPDSTALNAPTANKLSTYIHTYIVG
jgi:hypothetical protein